MVCGPCCGETKKDKQMAAIKRERHCTDILFFLLFALSWVIVIILTTQAVDAGADPRKITNGVDMYGRICGVSDGVKDRELAAFPHPGFYESKICVSDCAHTNDPASTDMHYRYESIAFTYYCLPNPLGNNSVPDFSVDVDGFESSSELLTRSVSDLLTSWVTLLLSPLLALLVTFLFTAINRKCAGVLVWTCLAVIILGGFLIGYALFQYGKDAEDSVAEERGKAAKVSGGIMIGATVIFLLIVIFLRKRIRIAIEVVKEASHLVTDMPTLMLFPLFPLAFMIGYMAFWVASSVYMFSVSELEIQPTPQVVREYNFLSGFDGCSGQLSNCPNSNPFNSSVFVTDDNWKAATVFNFFHLLWNAQFIFYFSYLVFAGAAADWYFTPYEGNSKPRGEGEGKLTRAPVLKSCIRTCRYHLGTVALTSLIIAIVQFIRAVVMYLERKTKSDPPNKVQRCIFACIQCWLKCLECCLDKINKNALIWTAIYGDSFATAACSSFALIWRNLARVAAVTVVSGTVLFITKVAITLSTVGIVGLILANLEYYEENLNSIVVPCCVVIIIAWIVASLFMAVFHSVIDTVFLCFLVDEEHNKGAGMMASESLQKLVGAYQKESQEAAAKQREDRSGRPNMTEEELGAADDQVHEVDA